MAVKILTTFFMSMLPIVELRGAIPVGVAAGLPLWEAIVISIIGNLIPVPFIIIFIKKIFAWMRTKSEKLNSLVDRMEAKAEGKKDKVVKYEFWGLFAFVAIPLPGTGAWTGSLIAALLDMDLKKAFPPIVLGVCTAGFIISVITYGAFRVITG
ncbi:MAG: small multi-drug export protein [Eubacteriales bacterium]|nr:small multi-drug export protein [Eubacteriales bacterium]